MTSLCPCGIFNVPRTVEVLRKWAHENKGLLAYNRDQISQAQREHDIGFTIIVSQSENGFCRNIQNIFFGGANV